MPVEERMGSEPNADGGPLYGWRRGWPLPTLATRRIRDVVIDVAPPADTLADLPTLEVVRRLAEGHVPFLLRVGGRLAAYGWSASGPAHIGGLDLTFTVPPDERYLWDFVTLPAYRGRGLYPLLLQEILRRQMWEAEWFWIGREPDNLASGRGILKAGFRPAGRVWRLPDGGLVFIGAPEAGPEVAARAARVLGLCLRATPTERAAPGTEGGS